MVSSPKMNMLCVGCQKRLIIGSQRRLRWEKAWEIDKSSPALYCNHKRRLAYRHATKHGVFNEVKNVTCYSHKCHLFQ